MKALNIALALLISVLMALLVFEGGLRLIPAFRPVPTINHFDPLTGWSNTPGRDVVRNVAGERIEFAINAQGLRDDPVAEKSAGTFRVLLLGDSFTLGYTVAREQCFADLLEQRWKAEGRAVEVLNAGTEGWSTDQEALWYIDRGVKFAPDLVLLFPYENDIYWNGELRYTRNPKPRFGADGQLEPRELVDPGSSGALARSAIAGFAKSALALTVRASKLGEFTVEGTQTRIAGEFAPLLLQEPGFVTSALSRTEGALVALERVCQSNGAELVVVPIPSKSALYADEREFFRTWEDGLAGLDDALWSPDRPVELFLALARKHAIACIDPRAALRVAAADARLYFERQLEWHFNVAGNRAFANLLHDELDAAGVFPAEHRAQRATPPADLHLPPPARPARWPYVFVALWAALTALYIGTYPKERKALVPLQVGAMLAAVFAIVIGGGKLVALVPHQYSGWVFAAFAVAVLGFVAYKLGRRVLIILELFRSFVERGHWYLMPLIVVLLTIGSLLVVAASSPLIAPFIYTLF